MIEDLFLLCGAIAVFLLGLKTLSEGTVELSGSGLSRILGKATGNRICAVMTGCACTAVAQSSVATNMIVISFVQKGVISFASACAVTMGTNIGTTVTAQLVSLSAMGGFDVAAIGSLIAFIGFELASQKSQKSAAIGRAMLGFGLVFIGIRLLSSSVEGFKHYRWFTNLFLVQSPLLLLLNGFLITAVMQSSSVVTSMIIILATLNLTGFKSAMFLVMGANVGTCLPVIISSAKLSPAARSCAYFNLAFNIVGVMLFFPVCAIFADQISTLAIFSGWAGRSIANFHTLFNIIVTLILLPLLTPFSRLAERWVSGIGKGRRRRPRGRGKSGACNPLGVLNRK